MTDQDKTGGFPSNQTAKDDEYSTTGDGHPPRTDVTNTSVGETESLHDERDREDLAQHREGIIIGDVGNQGDAGRPAGTRGGESRGGSSIDPDI